MDYAEVGQLVQLVQHEIVGQVGQPTFRQVRWRLNRISVDLPDRSRSEAMDKISAARRSENMRRIRAKDTAPEMAVRRLLRDMGFAGYRLHRSDLPGKPDIAFIGRKKAIVVNGCFWHGHDCKEGARAPKSNQQYWVPKIERNRQRDATNVAAMAAIGWSVLVVWECECKDLLQLSDRLRQFLVNLPVQRAHI